MQIAAYHLDDCCHHGRYQLWPVNESSTSIMGLWKKAFVLILVASSSTLAGDPNKNKTAIIDKPREVVATGGLPFIELTSALLEALTDKTAPIICESWSDDEALVRLAEKKAQAYIGWGDRANKELASMVIKLSSGEPVPDRIVLGRVGAMIITGKDNKSIHSYHISELRDVLGQDSKRESKQETNIKPKCYGVVSTSLTFQVVSGKAMRIQAGMLEGYRFFRKDIVFQGARNLVIESIKANPMAIGVIPFSIEPLPHGIKVLPIAPDGSETFVEPSMESINDKTYPLCREITLFVRHDVSSEIKRFCEYSVSEQAAIIEAKHGLLTSYQEKKYYGDQRLAEMKVGKGLKISSIELGKVEQVVRELGIEYVRNKTVIQLDHKTAAEQQAVATFVNNPASDMLVLEGQARDAVIKPVKDKWDDMVAKGMQRHVIAGRGVAVIVNSVNKLDSLTLDQLRDVFTGTTSDWNILGKDLVPAGTGDVSSSVFIGPNKPSPDARRGIILYGLASPTPGAPGNVPDPYFALFTRAIGQSKLTTYQAKKDSAETIAVVAMDPAAIAFVDASQLSTAAGKAIKVLAIGEPGKAVLPQSAAVMDGTYPLAEPITLYFMPKPDPVKSDPAGATQPVATLPANPTTGPSAADLPYKIINMPTSQPAMTAAQTKADFVAFILSGAPVETFRANGLICRNMDVIPPPPATKPAVEPTKNPKDKPNKPSKPTDTQPSKPDLPVWK